MTMNQMQYFSTVCRYHNITTAAKILMISQPGLSARLSELEAEVGVKLLERTSKGVSPTEEGARLLAHVEAVLGGIVCSRTTCRPLPRAAAQSGWAFAPTPARRR